MTPGHPPCGLNLKVEMAVVAGNAASKLEKLF